MKRGITRRPINPNQGKTDKWATIRTHDSTDTIIDCKHNQQHSASQDSTEQRFWDIQHKCPPINATLVLDDHYKSSNTDMLLWAILINTRPNTSLASQHHFNQLPLQDLQPEDPQTLTSLISEWKVTTNLRHQLKQRMQVKWVTRQRPGNNINKKLKA
eukprot:3153766-Amphidinium_carterae.1